MAEAGPLHERLAYYIRAADIGSDGDMDLVGANWSGPYQPVEFWENTSPRGSSR